MGYSRSMDHLWQPRGPDRLAEGEWSTTIQRVRAEFTEMPGLRLTLAQARRLFALRTDICERVLNTLAAAGVVVRAPDGRYSRRDAAA